MRLCSEPYRPPAKDNLRDAYAHLTNYSLNKKNHEKYQHTFAAAARLDEEGAGKEEGGARGEEKDAEVERGAKNENEIGESGDPYYAPVADEAGGGSKRKLSDVLPVLEAQSGGVFSSEVFWEKTKDLVAKTLVAYQPSLAIAYRRSFPRGRQRAPQQQQQQQQPESSRRKGAGKPAARRAKAPSPEVDDEEEDEDEEEGDDSFRCFHILGFDVLLSDQGRSAHLLEVNSNPSLGITHDIEPEDQDAHVIDLAHAAAAAKWGGGGRARARSASTISSRSMSPEKSTAASLRASEPLPPPGPDARSSAANASSSTSAAGRAESPPARLSPSFAASPKKA